MLSFFLRKTLANDAGKYFDPVTGVLEAPLLISVADQTRPVPFTLHAVVTTSDLSFDVEEVDFGYATIHECVSASVRLTNHSVLPQEFGFMNVPSVSY